MYGAMYEAKSDPELQFLSPAKEIVVGSTHPS